MANNILLEKVSKLGKLECLTINVHNCLICNSIASFVSWSEVFFYYSNSRVLIIMILNMSNIGEKV